MKFFRVTVCLLVCALFPGTLGTTSFAYVVPPEQLLEFMAGKVPGCQSIEVVWIRGAGGKSGDEGDLWGESVWFRPPDLLRVTREDGGVVDQGAAGLDAGYMGLFCARASASERLLAELGIAVDTSSYTRLDGDPVYRIGARFGEVPMLLLEKERFLPLLLVFTPRDARGLASVKFRDYRKTGEGWFPYEIVYQDPDGFVETYVVRDIKFDQPPPERPPRVARPGPGEESVGGRPPRLGQPSQSEKPAQPETPRKGGDEERLERIIRAFEEKFGEDGETP